MPGETGASCSVFGIEWSTWRDLREEVDWSRCELVGRSDVDNPGEVIGVSLAADIFRMEKSNDLPS